MYLQVHTHFFDGLFTLYKLLIVSYSGCVLSIHHVVETSVHPDQLASEEAS